MAEKALKNQNHQDPSLEQILSNIKDVINNRSPNVDVLELTELVTEADNQDARLANAERLISFKAAAESMKSVKSFLKAKETNDFGKVTLREGLTFEELVVESIKPELSDWLNKNLPDIVGNIVQREIKKLIPKDE